MKEGGWARTQRQQNLGTLEMARCLTTMGGASPKARGGGRAGQEWTLSDPLFWTPC